MRILLHTVLLSCLVPRLLSAAACCAGGSSLPTLILNDDRWGLRLTASNSFVVGEIEESNRVVWRESAFQERVFALSPSFVYRWDDFWQMGFRSVLKGRSYSENQSWGWGDSQVSMAYEPWPPYTYSKWTPRFFVAPSLLVPTGVSTYETDTPLLDATGNGFWSPGLAFIFSKDLSSFDFLLTSEARYQFSRSFRHESIEPGWIVSGKWGIAYHWKNFRWGLVSGPTYEETKTLHRAQATSPAKLVWDSDFEFSSRLSDLWSTTLSYSDQTLLGPAFHVDLQRAIALSVVYHGI